MEYNQKKEIKLWRVYPLHKNDWYWDLVMTSLWYLIGIFSSFLPLIQMVLMMVLAFPEHKAASKFHGVLTESSIKRIKQHYYKIQQTNLSILLVNFTSIWRGNGIATGWTQLWLVRQTLRFDVQNLNIIRDKESVLYFRDNF